MLFMVLKILGISIEELPPNAFTTADLVEVLSNDVVIQYLVLRTNSFSCLPVEILDEVKIYNLIMVGNPSTCECLDDIENWSEKPILQLISYLLRAVSTLKAWKSERVDL
ncbi:hypothetical protein BDFB_007100 [Asbolus verrucosus]|uniref:LRR 8 domain containing protein n=1 Tax=Asbolus verrucosus TaxID=1661398 RepID=A0A482W1K2_ASBVE|nr:hypothetical protein BDFB_007100 [Asbolus verrucosus]